MKAFRLNKQSNPLTVISIDPGFVSGVSVYTGDFISSLNVVSEERSVNLPYPEFYVNAVRAAGKLFDVVNSFKGSRRVLIEYTFLSGSFSVGLTNLTTVLVGSLQRRSDIEVLFVPTRMGSFFLKQRKTTKTEHVDFVKKVLGPNIRSTGRLSSHQADATMLMMAVEYEVLESLFHCEVRKPDVEFIDLDK